MSAPARDEQPDALPTPVQPFGDLCLCHEIIRLDAKDAQAVDRFDGVDCGGSRTVERFSITIEIGVVKSIDGPKCRVVAARLEQFIQMAFRVAVDDKCEVILVHVCPHRWPATACVMVRICVSASGA